MSETMKRCQKCGGHALDGECAMVPSVCAHRQQRGREIAQELRALSRYEISTANGQITLVGGIDALIEKLEGDK